MKPGTPFERTRATIIPAAAGFYIAQINFNGKPSGFDMLPVVAWQIEDSVCRTAVTTAGAIRYTEWENDGGPDTAVVGPDGRVWDAYRNEQFINLQAWLDCYALKQVRA